MRIILHRVCLDVQLFKLIMRDDVTTGQNRRILARCTELILPLDYAVDLVINNLERFLPLDEATTASRMVFVIVSRLDGRKQPAK